MNEKNKFKKSNGEICAVNEIFEKNANQVKTYGMVIKYYSRSGIHNMYKEYRDTSLNGSVSQMYMEMAGNHKALPDDISILRTATLNKAEDIKRNYSWELRQSNLKFPVLKKSIRKSHKKYNSTFAANRPNLYA